MRAADDERLATDVAECPHRRVHPARDVLFGDCEHLLRKVALRIHGRMMDEDSPGSNREPRRFSEYFRGLRGRSKMPVPFFEKSTTLPL
jgi:hypothetical protein